MTTLSHTPWGRPDHVEQIAPGIIHYTTPSHGGIWLSDERRAEIPDYMRAETFADNGEGRWYEEDGDWTLVALVFPEHFPDYHASACTMLKQWKPAIFERFVAERATAS